MMNTTFDFALMTERERLDTVLPFLWELASSLDPDAIFSELQLASIAYNTAVRACAKWSPDGIPFENYLHMRIVANIAQAMEAGGFIHPAEKILDIITEAGV